MSEVEDAIKEIKKCKNRKEVSEAYGFFLIAGLSIPDWGKLNHAILEKYKRSGLHYIKKLAWSRVEGDS